MQITIFGETGSVGDYLIDEALRQGHTVVPVSRHQHTADTRIAVKWQTVDYDDIASLAKTMASSDAAVISLGDYSVVKPTEHILLAMKQVGVTRVEIITGFGTSPASRQQLSLGMRAVILGKHPMLVTKEKQDKVVRQSGLDFTIIQPPTLTFGPATHAYRYGDYPHKSIRGSISRADLAEFMITNLSENRYHQESVYIQN